MGIAMNMLNLPKKVYFKRGCTPVALRELTEVYHLNRAFLISDPMLYRAGLVSPIQRRLESLGLRTAEFFSIGTVPSFEEIRSALPKMLEFQPDVMVGIGGSAAMSAAKALWALYENPELNLQQAADHPELIETGKKAKLVLVASSFGSGAQNSPFALLKNDAGTLCGFASFQLLPLISVTDADWTQSLSAEQVHSAALSLLSNAMQTFLKEDCCEYTQGFLLNAINLVLKNLHDAERGRPVALESLHNAGSLLGAAMGNVSLAAAPISWTTPLHPSALTSERAEMLAIRLGFPDAAALASAYESL